MLLEALEILQSAGEDSNTYNTDFATYKVVKVLTVYLPLFIATFLLSQEVFGQKIACLPPDNFTDGQADQLNEFCWNNGFWVREEIEKEESLYTQPHRYYLFSLATQAVCCVIPIIFWNITTKSSLLAVLRGTERFLEDLITLIKNGRHTEQPKVLEGKVIEQLQQFHTICLSAAEDSNLSLFLICRQIMELLIFSILLYLKIINYDHHIGKSFSCSIAEKSNEEILCSVPVLDLLDFIWSFNVACLTIAVVIVLYFIKEEIVALRGRYQPMFINELPYGEVDNFNEKVKWDNNFTKHSYELLTLIYEENATIMTQVYVLKSLKPMVESSDAESETEEETELKERGKDTFYVAVRRKILKKKLDAIRKKRACNVKDKKDGGART